MQVKSAGLGVLFVILVASVTTEAAELGVPKAVERAVAAIFGAQKQTIEHEQEGGVDRYEVAAPTTLEVVLDAKGKVEEVEVKLPVGLVPPLVLKAAGRALPPGARIVEAELLLVGGAQVLYEVEAQVEGREVEVVLGADGALVSQRSEQEERVSERED